MGFNIEKMFEASVKAIQRFAKEHKNETFYAFSIDGSMLCLNSLECFAETLKYYQSKWPEEYAEPKNIEDLKQNTGDWEYTGFFDLEEGFDHELYSDHYHIPFENKKLSNNELLAMFEDTLYHTAMASLMQKILDSRALDLLNKTTDFKAFLSEHNY